MAFYYCPMSDIQIYSVLNLYGNYNIPVYSISQFQSKADLAAYRAAGYNNYWFYGDKGSDAPANLVRGDYTSILADILKTVNDTDYGKTSSNVVTNLINKQIPWGNNTGRLLYTLTQRKDLVSLTYRAGASNNSVESGVFLQADGGKTTASTINTSTQFGHGDNSSGMLFGTFVEDDVRYYFRLPLYITIINESSTDYPARISGHNTSQDTYALEFFGMKAGYEVTLSQIASGTATDTPVPVNPYEPIDPSGPGGGGGTFDLESDPVPLPSLPSISSADTGFTRIFNPTLAQVRALANYMWTDESFFSTAWNRVKQVFENPMSAIIAFNLVPVPVPDGGNVPFKLMYIDTGVTMNTAANQFVDVDCGTLEVEKVYGSALDYSPYTKVSCFLPFVGTVTLSTDDIMGHTLQVKYRVDICSGACVAVILVDGTVMYQFTGHCAINIPMNSADFSSYISALTAAAKIALGAASGAGLIGAAADVPEVTQTTGQTTIRTTARNPETGRQIVTSTQTIENQSEESTTKASHDGLVPANVANTVGSVMGSKPHIERSGSFTGNSGYLGVRRPYLIIERPNLCMPANYQALNGFPSMMTLSLSSCKGFTRVQQVKLTNCTATNPEQAEILEFLKAGVYL